MKWRYAIGAIPKSQMKVSNNLSEPRPRLTSRWKQHSMRLSIIPISRTGKTSGFELGNWRFEPVIGSYERGILMLRELIERTLRIPALVGMEGDGETVARQLDVALMAV